MSDIGGIGLAGENLLQGAQCECQRCERGRRTDTGIWWGKKFIVCATCGNKRCPRASDHDLACTGSNEPGQPGSVYE